MKNKSSVFDRRQEGGEKKEEKNMIVGNVKQDSRIKSGNKHNHNILNGIKILY